MRRHVNRGHLPTPAAHAAIRLRTGPGGLALGVALLVASLATPPAALANSPVDGNVVLLGFGQTYGGGSVHRGIDLGAGEGDAVHAPAAGTISFAGAVPADGGGTVVAVTIDLADGTKVTVMPLARAAAKRGTAVEAGQLVGSLAGSGDASSAEPHVHVSLRRGSVYLDPTGLLVAPPAQGSNKPQTSGSGETQSTPSATGGESVAGAASTAVSSAGAGARTVQTAASSGGAGRVVSANGGLASGVTLAPRAAAGGVLPAPQGVAGVGVDAPTGATAALPAGVVTVGTGAAATHMGAERTVRGVDLTALIDQVEASVARYAGRHLRALGLGVCAFLTGVAALTPLGGRARSGGAVCSVRPEGDAVAAAAGR